MNGAALRQNSCSSFLASSSTSGSAPFSNSRSSPVASSSPCSVRYVPHCASSRGRATVKSYALRAVASDTALGRTVSPGGRSCSGGCRSSSVGRGQLCGWKPSSKGSAPEGGSRSAVGNGFIIRAAGRQYPDFALEEEDRNTESS